MKSRLCIVDDDEIILDSLGALFASRNLRGSLFGDPERFLSIWTTSEIREVPTTIVLEIRMPKLSGLDVFAQMNSMGLPKHNSVIFLTGHGDVPLAVEAMKAGAYDFVEKPFSDNTFVDRVIQAMQYAETCFNDSLSPLAHQRQLSQLTSRELLIAQQIRLGKTNRPIGDELAISRRTVEVHRARIFEKLNVKNAFELVQFLGPLSPTS